MSWPVKPSTVQIGHVYSSWTVIAGPFKHESSGKTVWQCRCACGTLQTMCIFNSTPASPRCGRCSDNRKRPKGTEQLSVRIYKKLRNAVSHAIAKCTDPSNRQWSDYGGRGITVYQPWIADKDAFLVYLTTLAGCTDPKLVLDRMDNAKGYEPDNLRLISLSDSRENRRDNRLYIANANMLLPDAIDHAELRRLRLVAGLTTRQLAQKSGTNNPGSVCSIEAGKMQKIGASRILHLLAYYDSLRVGTLDYATFQAEHSAWLETMYPGQPAWLPACGCIEEATELLHAITKRMQTCIWGAESRYANTDWRAKMVDAVADCAIFACSLCNANGWAFSIVATAKTEKRANDALQETVQLILLACQVAENCSLQATAKYFAQLRIVASLLGVDLDYAISKVWQEVRTRCK